MAPTLKQIVANNNPAKFSHYRDGNFFYNVEVEGDKYAFPISLEEAKGATMLADFKAITLMRWIRKALDANTFQPVK